MVGVDPERSTGMAGVLFGRSIYEEGDLNSSGRVDDSASSVFEPPAEADAEGPGLLTIAFFSVQTDAERNHRGWIDAGSAIFKNRKETFLGNLS